MLNQTSITLIAAMDNNHVIGNNNALLWHLPNDFAFFKKQTLNKTILMGRKTWDSLPLKPLPKRSNLVLSNQTLILPEGVNLVNSLNAAVQQTPNQALLVIGGSTVYELALPYADKLILTHVNAALVGDAYFPNFDPKQWSITWREQHAADDRHAYDYTFQIYQRKK